MFNLRLHIFDVIAIDNTEQNQKNNINHMINKYNISNSTTIEI